MKKRPQQQTLTPKSTAIGRKAFAAITAVPGLELTESGRKRVSSACTPEKRRADVIKAYAGGKGRK